MVAAALTAALLVAGACSDGRDSQPGATVPAGGDEPSTSAPATTLGAEAYAVPEVIDQEYVQRVVSAYDKVLGDAIRILKRDEGVSEEFLEHLVAIYTEPEFEFQQQVWLESVAAGRLERTPANPGDPVTSVGTIVKATTTCVTFRAEQNDRANFTGTTVESEQDDYMILVRKKPNRDPRQVNPTPWVIAFDGFKNDNSVPRDSCGD